MAFQLLTLKHNGCIMEQDSLGQKIIGEKTGREGGFFMKKKIGETLILGVGVFFVLVLGYSFWGYFMSEPATSVAIFEEQLAEQKQQADVASQLRAAEMGDYAEMLDGTMLGVWWTSIDSDGTKRVVLCGFGGNRCTIDDSVPISLAVRRVRRIIKLYGPDAEVLATAREFMRQY